MATINLQVGQGTDDCYTYHNGSATPTYIYLSKTINFVSRVDSASITYFNGYRFTGVNIAQGKKITSAIFSLKSHANYSCAGHKVTVCCQDSDNTSTFSTTTDFGTRNSTPESTVWTLSNWATDQWYQVDIKDSVQRVINRAGWSSGNSLVVFTKVFHPTQTANYAGAKTYESGSANAAKLDITYEDSTTTTVYFTPTVDGIVDRAPTPYEFFNVIREGNGTLGSSAFTTATSTMVGMSSDTNKYFRIRRGIFNFNTASLPDDANILSASFFVFPTNINNPTYAYTAPSLALTPGYTASNTSIVASDYQGNLLSTQYASDISLNDLIYYVSLASPGKYIEMPFNTSGIAGVSLTTYTKLATKIHWDAYNITPTWETGDLFYMGNYFSGQADKAPLLKVVYGTAPVSTEILTPPAQSVGGIHMA